MSASYRAIVRTESAVVLQQRAREQLPPASVRVRIERTGLCRTDCRVAQGLIPSAANIALGHEASGVILEVRADESSALRVGDHVTLWPHIDCLRCDACLHGRPCQSIQLGVDRDGTFAEEAIVPLTNVYSVPADMGFERAAYFEPLVAALGAQVDGLEQGHAICVVGRDRIAELTRRALHFQGHRLVALTDDPQWVIVPTPDLATVRALATQATRATFVLKLASRGPRIDAPTYERLGLRVVTAMYGSRAQALALLEAPDFVVEDLFEAARPLSALKEHLLANDAETKKAFFNPRLPD